MMADIPNDIREKARDFYYRSVNSTSGDIAVANIAAALLAEREETVRKCVNLAQQRGEEYIQPTRSALEARIQVLEAAIRRQVENIERWLETGEPASAEESKSIYEQLKDAIA